MKRNFDRKTYAELRDLYTHYQGIFPDVKNRAKPLIRWYIKSLATEIDRFGRAYALLKRTGVAKIARRPC